MSRCAELIEDIFANFYIKVHKMELLRDRTRTMSEQSQIYGTQFDVDEEGWPIPLPVQEPEAINE